MRRSRTSSRRSSAKPTACPGRSSGRRRSGGLQLRAADCRAFRPGDDVVLCVRPPAVRVRRTAGAAAGDNLTVGRLVQRAYLGDLEDLRIALPGGVVVRAFVPAGQRYEPGEELLVELPADACRLVRP